MNLIALAELAFAGAKIEEVGQLTKDGLTLYHAYQKLQGGEAPSALTEADLNDIIPALSRTAIVLGDLWAKSPTTVLNALKGV